MRRHRAPCLLQGPCEPSTHSNSQSSMPHEPWQMLDDCKLADGAPLLALRSDCPCLLLYSSRPGDQDLPSPAACMAAKDHGPASASAPGCSTIAATWRPVSVPSARAGHSSHTIKGGTPETIHPTTRRCAGHAAGAAGCGHPAGGSRDPVRAQHRGGLAAGGAQRGGPGWRSLGHRPVPGASMMAVDPVLPGWTRCVLQKCPAADRCLAGRMRSWVSGHLWDCGAVGVKLRASQFAAVCACLAAARCCVAQWCQPVQPPTTFRAAELLECHDIGCRP